MALSADTNRGFQEVGQYVQLNASAATIWNGAALMLSAGSNTGAEVGTAAAGFYLGIAQMAVTNASTQDAYIDTRAKIIKDISPTGTSVTKNGFPVWGTDDTTFTLTYATGAKFVGVLFPFGTAEKCLDLGLVGNAAVALAGGVKHRTILGTFAATDIFVADLYVPFVTYHPINVTKIGFRNISACSATNSSITISLRSGATTISTAYTTEITGTADMAKNAENYVTPSGGYKFAQDSTVSLYVDSVGSVAVTAGIVQAYVEYENVLC